MRSGANCDGGASFPFSSTRDVRSITYPRPSQSRSEMLTAEKRSTGGTHRANQPGLAGHITSINSSNVKEDLRRSITYAKFAATAHCSSPRGMACKIRYEPSLCFYHSYHLEGNRHEYHGHQGPRARAEDTTYHISGQYLNGTMSKLQLLQSFRDCLTCV